MTSLDISRPICDVCGRLAKHFDMPVNQLISMGYCGYHKRYANSSTMPSSSSNEIVFTNQIVLPKCCAMTKLGIQCKRIGTVIHLENVVYCYQHKPPAQIQESTVIPGYIRDDCPICYSALMDGTTLAKTHCGHFFHKACILQWKNSSPQGNTCPICRRDTHVSRNASVVTKIYTNIEEF
jgi:hypothetical protein